MAAIAAGVEAAGASADACPLADGGEGTAAALLEAGGGRRLRAPAHDPLGRPLEADFALLGEGETAVVEVAAASGLALLREDERDAERADSHGTGELIVAAARSGARRILVAAGGSATSDGGRGAIGAIRAAGGLGEASLEVLCDVAVPYEEAAAVFAPQKGAGPAAVRRLERRLEEFAANLPRDPRGVPMGGCAGGLSGGLMGAFGARLVPGAEFVLEAVGFGARLAAARAVITGEGRLDDQSVRGKLVGTVAAACAEVGRPLHAIAGQIALGEAASRQLRLASAAEASTLEEIEAAAERIAAS